MIQLDLRVVGLVVGIIFLLTVGILLTIAIIKLIRLLNKANKILDINFKNINNTLSVLPEATENFNDACIEAKKSFENVSELTENVSGIVATASGAEEVMGGFANIVTIISNIIGFVSGLFNKSDS